MPNLPVRAAGEAVPAATRITLDIHPDELPEVYAMIVEGDCMLPYIRSDTKMVFSRTEAWQPGDMVLIYMRLDRVPAGEHQVALKRLVTPPPEWARFGVDTPPDWNVVPVVVVEQFNPRTRYTVPMSNVLAIHKCLGPVPGDVATYIVTDAEAREIGKGGVA